MVHTVNTKIASCAPCLSPSPYLSVPYFLPSFGEQHTHMALCLLTGCHTPFLNPHAETYIKMSLIKSPALIHHKPVGPQIPFLH